MAHIHRCKRCGKHQKHPPIWSTELHGLCQFFISRSSFTKALWAIVIGMCLVSAVWFTKVLIREYLEKRTSTVFEYKQVTLIRFPGVTICPKHGDALHYRDLEIDMRGRVSNLSNSDVDDLIIFVIAGSGLSGFGTKVSLWEERDIEWLAEKTQEWKGERSWSAFFEFVFSQNGYTCEELFHRCFYGPAAINCCDIFRPVYVLLTGRCFQLYDFYQTSPQDWGRLHIYLNDIPSHFLSSSGRQNSLLLYLSDNYPDVARYPMFHINKGPIHRIILQMRNLSMSEADQHCSNSDESQGRGTCFTNVWLKNQLIDPFNCTVHYLLGRAKNVPICLPEVVVSNYNSIINNHVNTKHCRPACERSMIIENLHKGKPQGYSSAKAPYSVALSYSDMQIEVYRENVRITLAGFISEIGGQVMLFMGISLNTVVQLLLLLFGRVLLHKHPIE